MQVRWLARMGMVAALAVGVAACGEDEESAGGGQAASENGGGDVTIYSSLPLQGASRTQSEAVIKGIKLAIKQADNKAGDMNVKYVSLDDSTAAAGKWEANQVNANARKVAQDDSAIAYIGEFNSGATVLSIPVLNEAGMLQVSPSATAYGLTKSGPGADAGEPAKYYPTGERNFGRVVPADHIQAAAVAQYMQDEEVTKVYIIDDTEVYGQGLAKNTQTAAEKLGLQVVGTDSWEGKASNYRALANKIKESGADGVFTGGIIDNNGPQLYKDLHAAMPDVKLFGPDGLATQQFAKDVPDNVAAQTFLTVASVAATSDELPPAGKKFYEDYQAEYNEAVDEIDPYAVFGYEAAAAVLESIEKGGNDRQAVIDAFFAIENRESPLGTYSIDENGDTTLSIYGGYRLKDQKLSFDRVLEAEAV